MTETAKFNGKVNGIEGKTPFLIGVGGGTASGKVHFFISHIFLTQTANCDSKINEAAK